MRHPAVEYAFGSFTLSPSGLTCGERAIELAPTPLGVLHALVSSSPRTVPHGRLAVAAWQRGVASAGSIARAVHRLRRVLNEHQSGTGDWVETVWARGYRFAPEARVERRPHDRSLPTSRAVARAGAAVPASRWCLDGDALLALRPERLGDAAERYARALELDPNSVHARRGLAECAIWSAVADGRRRTIAPALDQLLAARRLAPRDPRLQACRGLVAIVTGSDPAAATEFARLALVAAPGDPRVAWHAGLVALCNGDRQLGTDLIAAAAFGEPGHERLRRHWAATVAGLDPALRGADVLRTLERCGGGAADRVARAIHRAPPSDCTSMPVRAARPCITHDRSTA